MGIIAWETDSGMVNLWSAVLQISKMFQSSCTEFGEGDYLGWSWKGSYAFRTNLCILKYMVKMVLTEGMGGDGQSKRATWERSGTQE